MKRYEFYPTALTIAGSDNTGGAGIQSDIRTFSAFGVYGCSVVTAITSQTPTNIKHITGVCEDAVISQLETIFSNISVRALKTGMLFSADITDCVCKAISKYAKRIQIIVDPVMYASAGNGLFDTDKPSEFMKILMEKLFPLASWITPNITEAETIIGEKIETFEDAINAGLSIAKQYETNCIIKGGHMEAEHGYTTDIVVKDNKVLKLVSPRVPLTEKKNGIPRDIMKTLNLHTSYQAKGKMKRKTLNLNNVSHGTGCTFSAALTAAFALGMSWKDALKAAKAFVFGSLEEYVRIGDNMYAMYPPVENYLKYVKLNY